MEMDGNASPISHRCYNLQDKNDQGPCDSPQVTTHDKRRALETKGRNGIPQHCHAGSAWRDIVDDLVTSLDRDGPKPKSIKISLFPLSIAAKTNQLLS